MVHNSAIRWGLKASTDELNRLKPYDLEVEIDKVECISDVVAAL